MAPAFPFQLAVKSLAEHAHDRAASRWMAISTRFDALNRIRPGPEACLSSELLLGKLGVDSRSLKLLGSFERPRVLSRLFAFRFLQFREGQRDFSECAITQLLGIGF